MVMCLPWNHKWSTVTLLLKGTFNINQRCTHCGKEIVRKYRV